MIFSEQQQHFMKLALREAEKAFDAGEAPVGAVVVLNNKVIGKGYNRVEALKDPTAHAEILAITAACNSLEDKFLTGAEIYVTLEPCLLCAGAILLSRIDKIYYAAPDLKFGACGTLYNVVQEGKYNHTCKVFQGLYENESAMLLKAFFSQLREKNPPAVN